VRRRHPTVRVPPSPSAPSCLACSARSALAGTARPLPPRKYCASGGAAHPPPHAIDARAPVALALASLARSVLKTVSKARGRRSGGLPSRSRVKRAAYASTRTQQQRTPPQHPEDRHGAARAPPPRHSAPDCGSAEQGEEQGAAKRQDRGPGPRGAPAPSESFFQVVSRGHVEPPVREECGGDAARDDHGERRRHRRCRCGIHCTTPPIARRCSGLRGVPPKGVTLVRPQHSIERGADHEVGACCRLLLPS
jgi:hypothetical protein